VANGTVVEAATEAAMKLLRFIGPFIFSVTTDTSVQSRMRVESIIIIVAKTCPNLPTETTNHALNSCILDYRYFSSIHCPQRTMDYAQNASKARQSSKSIQRPSADIIIIPSCLASYCNRGA
jgi:hypothetical protein